MKILRWTAAPLGVLLVAVLSGSSDDQSTSAGQGSEVTASPSPPDVPAAPTTPKDANAPATTDTSEDLSTTTIGEAMEIEADHVPGDVVAGGRTDEQGKAVWYVAIRSEDDQAVPGAQLVEIELDREDGIQAWYVFLRGGDAGQQEVYIDAARAR